MPSSLVFRDVSVLDVTNGQWRPAQTVVVVDQRIQAMGAANTVRIPGGATVIDARGKYLIPGLWALHEHPWFLGTYYPELSYPLYIANGVTGIRSVNIGCLEEALQLRRAILARRHVGPRQFISGPALDGVNENPEVRESCGHSLSLRVTSPEQAQPLVDSLKAAGVDLIKVYEPSSREVYFAIARAARRAGLRFGGHVAMVPGSDNQWLVTAAEASDSGQTLVDHGLGMAGICVDTDLFWRAVQVTDSVRAAKHREAGTPGLEKCAALAERLRRNRTWMVLDPGGEFGPRLRGTADLEPRLARRRYHVGGSRGDSAQWRPEEERQQPALEQYAAWARTARPLELLGRAGVPLVSGSHAEPGTAAGFSLVDVVVNAVEWGLTPLGALQAATVNAAQALGAADSVGTVTAGKLADLVLLDGDPLADIHQLRAVRAVVANGRYFDRAALDVLLADAARTAAIAR